MAKNLNMLQGWVDALKAMPPPKGMATLEINAERLTKATCCGCKKLVDIREFKVRNSGVTFYLENVCQGCKKGLSEKAAVVCVGKNCRVIVVHIDPHKDKVGFFYRGGKVYHTEACPTCKPGLNSAVVLEKVIYDRRKGINHPLTKLQV